MNNNNNNSNNRVYGYPKLTAWPFEPSFKELSTDLTEADSSRQTQIDKIVQYREDMDGGKPISNTVRSKGKSTQRPLVIRKQAEWAYPVMEEPFLSTQDMFIIQPRGRDDEDAAKQNGMLLNWFMSTKINKSAFISEMVRTLYDEGTVIVKDGWTVEEEEVEVEEIVPVYGTPEESLVALQQQVQAGQIDEAQAQAMMEMGEPVQIGEETVMRVETRTVSNHPTLEVVDNTNIIVDPTCDGEISRAQFIIHEYETDYATLRSQKYDPKTKTGIYKNLSKVRFESEKDNPYGDYDSTEKTSFFFQDKPRAKVKAYEYWGYWDIDGRGGLTPIVATWIGEVMVRLEKNPYSHQELPFSVARYMPRKKEFWGQPDGELLKENQETIGIYTRAMHDQTITNALGQKLVDETLFNSPSQWQAFQKGNDARFRPGANPDTMIWKSKIEPIDKSAFDMINFQRADAESIIGKKAFGEGISGASLGSSVGGIRSAMDATSKRNLGVLRRISDELLRNLARHMLVNAQEFLDEETVVRLSDGEFVDILKQDLQMEFDLRVDINTPEKEQEVSDKIAFMYQTMSNDQPSELQKIMMKKWATVNKMPDIVKDIDEMPEPEPSPEEIKMQQMQMQIMELDIELKMAELAKVVKETEKIDANISETILRTQDNQDKKASTANVQNAQAEKIRSEQDELDARFIEHRSGRVREKELQDKAMDFEAQAAIAEQTKTKEGNK